jgi:hypothetical protein
MRTLIDRGQVVGPRASVDDDQRVGDTFGTEVGSCIPLALALAFDIAEVEVGFGVCRARMTGQMGRLNQRRLIASPILPRMLYAQRPYIELATFPSYVVCHQLLPPDLRDNTHLVASSMLEAVDMTDGALSASSGRMAVLY